MRIMIDPGHRNNALDYGACANGQKESVLALKISQRLKTKLEKLNVICYMTREDESHTIDISSRTKKALSLKCDLFISIHINSASNSQANGIEVLYRNEKDLAESVCNALYTLTNAANRGAKLRTDLGVLNGFKNTILIECGFISHPEECSKLTEETYQELIVEGITDGIIKRYNLTALDNDTEVELYMAVNKLIAEGAKINAAAWNRVQKMNLKYAELLIEKIGKVLFNTKNYEDTITAFHEHGMIEDIVLWHQKRFTTKLIRSLIIKASNKI